MSEFLQQAKQRLDSNAGACRLVIRQFRSLIKIIVSRTTFRYGVTIDCAPFKAALEREAAWEGRPEHLFPPIYLGSFVARTSAFSMDGGAERSSDAFSINLAATLPER